MKMVCWGGVIITTAYHKRTVQDMIETCIQLGIRDEDVYLIPNKTLVTGIPDDGNLLIPYQKCVQIFQLDIHIADHCNLNCELCCHNSQLVEGEVLVGYEEYQRDLRQLHKLVPDICNISVLGGEPLLHPDLIHLLQITREIYPYTNITMVTNGLLLGSSSPELIECLKRNDIGIAISLYPPMHHRLDEMLKFIKSTGIKASVKRVQKFFKKFSATPKFDPREMTALCGYVMGLRNGRISRCVDSL